jgi:large subunit ribosomal protein L3
MSFQLIGIKRGMSRIFNEAGELIPVTVIETGPCTVLQIKTVETDGYNAVQLGFGTQKEKNATKPLLGHYKKAGIGPKKYARENRVDKPLEYKIGQEIKCDFFAEGDIVDVTGITKGRGFTGPMRRWNFQGGPASHGAKFHRELGSVGQAAYPGRIFKGKKMAGHYGAEKMTTENIRVAKVMLDENLVLVRGAVPGATGGMVLIRKAMKKKVTSNKKK